MNALARPRGPLPPRTYWARRLLLLATALALAVGAGNLLGRGSDGDGSGQQVEGSARIVSADPSTSPAGVPPGVRSGTTAKTTKKQKAPPLAQPEGTCVAEDIAVRPVVTEAVAGDPVRLSLRLTTNSTPACYWQVSDQSLALTITSGKDSIWTTRECTRSVPKSDVVLRQAEPVWVHVRWSARRSDEGCTKTTLWALPGWYHLEAAALAGEPQDVQFRLLKPQAEVITEPPKPKPKPKRDDTDRQT
jgi:hypothetical protein